MFNRVVRCLSVAKKPLSLNRASGNSNQSLPSTLLIPKNNISLLKSICTSATRRSETEVQEEPRTAPRKTAEAIELESLLASDPDVAKRYKILELEVDVMRQGGYSNVPETLKPQHWLELLKTETRTARKKYLQYLFLTEKTNENRKEKKERARMERDRLRESGEEDTSNYRLHRTTMFLRIYDTTMNQFYHSRLIQAMQFSEKLVIDCGYYAHMTDRECKECAKQLALLFAANRTSKHPFDLHFCNVNKSSVLMKTFIKTIPTAYDDNFPLNIHERSYTEVFDRNKLIYLTPHTQNEMTEYDHDSIYIIGGIVDKTNSEPLSLARAKEDGLKMAKLPLDKYLLWGSGSGKRLPLNQMVDILSDVKVTGDWQSALRHVPRRKLEKSLDEMTPEDLARTRPQSFERARPQSFDGARPQSFERAKPQSFERPRSQSFERPRSQKNFGYNQRTSLSRDTEEIIKSSFSFEARQKGYRNK